MKMFPLRACDIYQALLLQIHYELRLALAKEQCNLSMILWVVFERSINNESQQLVIQSIQIMNVGHSIDVHRIMNDNQRYQRDLSYYQHQQQQLRSQLDKSLAANHQLKEDCIRSERQKQQQLDKFIANHRQIYQAELAHLTAQNQTLQTEIQKHKQQAKNSYTQLNSLMEQKDKVEGEMKNLRRLRLQDQKEKYNMQAQLTNKREAISLLQQDKLQQQDLLQQLKQKIEQTRGKHQRLQQSYSLLNNKYKSIQNSTPQGILQEIFKLRSQNISLLNNEAQHQLLNFNDDQQIYSLIQKLHQDTALLRYQVNEAKNLQTQTDMFYLQQRESFQNSKAQLQLNAIKFEREIATIKQENQKLRRNICQLQSKQKNSAEQIQKRTKLQEQLALLQIKVFVFQSLQNSKRQHRSKIQAFNSQSKHIDMATNIGSMQLLMSQTVDKLKQQQSRRRELGKRVKEYKQKCEFHTKNQSELLKMVEQSRAKEQQYRRLIDRIQRELERSYQINNNILQQAYNQNQSLPPNHQQVNTLKNQIDRSQQSIQLLKNHHAQQIQKLKRQIVNLQSSISQWQQKNHKLEGKLLEQSLNLPASKINKNYQVELAEKTSALITAEQELQKLRNQFVTEKEINQGRLLTINQLNLKMESLSHDLSFQVRSKQEQISQLKQQNAYLQGMLGEKRHSDGNRILTLCEEIVHLKTQSNDFKQDTLDRSDRAYAAEREIQSYRNRLLQLQEALRVMNTQNQQKSLQIFRLSKQNNILSKQLDKLQDQLQALRGKAASMRQFQLLDHNKELEDECQTTKRELSEALQIINLKQAQLQALKKQSDQAWKNNLQLSLTINEHAAQTKEIQLKNQLRQKQYIIKEQQIYNKVSFLQNDNSLLKKQLEDLRFILLEKQYNRVDQEVNSKNQKSILEIEGKNKQIIYLKQQLQRLRQQRVKQKQIFDKQWNQLSLQLRQAKQKVNLYLNQQSNSQQSRINIAISENSNNLQANNLLNKITELQKQLLQKDQQIKYLQSQKSEFQFSINSKDIYTQQLVEARNQNQRLLQIKYKLQNRLRVLQQENSLLNIRKISQQPINTQVIFSEQTFGPSLASSQLIQQLRYADPQPQQQTNQSIRQRYQQALLLLVISWAQIESLRVLIAQIQRKSKHNYQQYTDKLKAIQNNIDYSQRENFNFPILIKQLQCSHRHIVQIAQRRFSQGKEIGLDQMGTFTESIRGGKLIESYSVREEQSPNSQEHIQYDK